jgi:hypothetical protein
MSSAKMRNVSLVKSENFGKVVNMFWERKTKKVLYFGDPPRIIGVRGTVGSRVARGLHVCSYVTAGGERGRP